MSELKSLSDIFQNTLFRIPDYQRGYAWQEKQLVDFWEDLINLRPEQGRYHYTGLLSLKPLDKSDAEKLDRFDQWLLESGFKAKHIVDGQQRLTTFMILLNELLIYVCHLPENEGKDDNDVLLGYDTVRDIRAKYICRTMPHKQVITYLFGYETDNPSSKYLIYKIFGQKYAGDIQETYYTRNLKLAKDFFSREIDSIYQERGIHALTEIYKKLTTQMMFNIHEIEADYDVFVAFETMNNRGKRLTNLELLKNRLIYLTTLYSDKELSALEREALRNKINDAWKEVYYQLGRNTEKPLSDDEFLRANWLMNFPYSRTNGEDYINFLLHKFSQKSIYINSPVDSSSLMDSNLEVNADYDEDEVEDDPLINSDDKQDTAEGFLTPEEIENYVGSLNQTAQWWYYTQFPEECNYICSEEKLWIGKLHRIGIGYFAPLVAVSLNPEHDAKMRISLYKAIERFIFINFRLGMFQATYKSSDVYKFTRQIYYGEIALDSVTKALNDISTKNANDAIVSFIAKMNPKFSSGIGFYGWGNIYYFLFEYENSLAIENALDKIIWSDFCKRSRDKITIEHILPQTPTKQYWQDHFKDYQSQIKFLSGSLGNLLPLSQRINSSLQNDGFDLKKKERYYKGSYSEIEVSKEEDWDANRILSRGMKLLHFMERRWSISFESELQMVQLLHLDYVYDKP